MSSGNGYPSTYIETDFIQNPAAEKLPLADLSRTLKGYLTSLEAVVNGEQLARATEQVKEFGRPGGLGEKLQKKLEEKAQATENYAYDWWLNDMYLKNRLALPVNSNPGMVLPRQNFKTKEDQLRFSAKMILGILDFKIKLDKGELAVDAAGSGNNKFHMCMAQYYRLLSAYRRPRIPKDVLLSTSTREASGNYHVIIVYKHQFFALPVMRHSEKIPQKLLVQRLKEVIKMTEHSPVDPPVGLLTSDHRDNWAKAHKLLTKHITNQSSLDMIERSLCVVCLEDPLPLNFNRLSSEGKSRDDSNSALQMLHGGGSKYYSANRWFDKTLQLIVSSDGICGLCYEHSPAEGIVVIQLLEDIIQKDMSSTPVKESSSGVVFPFPDKLSWRLESQDLQAALSIAATNIDKLAVDLDFFVYRFNVFGREFPKSVKCSPDAFIQLALQLTYFKVHKKLVSTYESAGTRRFRFGRVDNIRAATAIALAWAKAMTGDNQTSDEEKLKLFRTCLATHVEIMTSNITGQGIDCHLLCLRELCKEMKQPLPALFTDDCFTIFNWFALSTSQVPTQTDSFMGYGPVVPNGYGASYNPHKDSIVFCISSFRSDPDTDSEQFANHLGDSLIKMKELLDGRRTSVPAVRRK